MAVASSAVCVHFGPVGRGKNVEWRNDITIKNPG